MLPKIKEYFSRTALAGRKAGTAAKKDSNPKRKGSPLKIFSPFKKSKKEVKEVDSAQTSDTEDEPDPEELEEEMAELEAMDEDQNHSDAIMAINEDINITNLETCPIKVSQSIHQKFTPKLDDYLIFFGIGEWH